MNMKRIFYQLALSISVIAAGSCAKEIDNYAGPTETLQGKIVDAGTGENVQSEVSGENGTGTRIELRELSWSENPTPLYLATKQDGTYSNTKVFAGRYKISADGAFVPLVQTGATPVDKSQTVDVKGGVTTVDFTVEPFLRLEWVGDPVLNADGTLTVKVKITRGTANPAFQLNVTDINLYINSFKYVGNNANSFDARYSNRVAYTGTAGNNLLGQTISITTTGGALPKKRDWHLRVGARTTYPNNGRPFNYSTVRTVAVP